MAPRKSNRKKPQGKGVPLTKRQTEQQADRLVVKPASGTAVDNIGTSNAPTGVAQPTTGNVAPASTETVDPPVVDPVQIQTNTAFIKAVYRGRGDLYDQRLRNMWSSDATSNTATLELVWQKPNLELIVREIPKVTKQRPPMTAPRVIKAFNIPDPRYRMRYGGFSYR